VIGRYVTELYGVPSSFCISGILLVLPFIIGCRLFPAYILKEVLEPLDMRNGGASTI